jgi:hypothetical protein
MGTWIGIGAFIVAGAIGVFIINRWGRPRK